MSRTKRATKTITNNMPALVIPIRTATRAIILIRANAIHILQPTREPSLSLRLAQIPSSVQCREAERVFRLAPGSSTFNPALMRIPIRYRILSGHRPRTPAVVRLGPQVIPPRYNYRAHPICPVVHHRSSREGSNLSSTLGAVRSNPASVGWSWAHKPMRRPRRKLLGLGDLNSTEYPFPGLQNFTLHRSPPSSGPLS